MCDLPLPRAGGTRTAAAAQGSVETRAALSSAKAAKAVARRLREGGQRPQEAARAGLATVAPKRKQTASEKQRVRGASGSEPAPKAARSSSSTRVYAGGGRSAPVKPPARSGLSAAQQARAARGGRGRAQFKSKAKHKRR